MKSFIAALRSLVLPFGALSGARIVLDGVNGQIQVYDSSNTLIISIASNGIHVQGATRQWDINSVAGFLSRRSPDDGTKAQIFDAGLFLTGQTPTPVNGAVINTTGELFASNTAGPNEAPYVNLVSPNYVGKPGQAAFYAQGQGSLSASDDSLALVQGARTELRSPTIVPTNNFALQDTNGHPYLSGENQLFFQTVNAGATSVVVPITFTHPFTRAPQVSCSTTDPSSNFKTWVTRPISITTTGFSYFAYSLTGTALAATGTIALTWTATEYTP